MQEVSLSDVNTAFTNFKEMLKKYVDYLNYLETKVRADKLTEREQEILRKHGRKVGKK